MDLLQKIVPTSNTTYPIIAFYFNFKDGIIKALPGAEEGDFAPGGVCKFQHRTAALPDS